MRTCVVLWNCAKERKIIFEFLEDLHWLDGRSMRDDWPHSHYILGLWPPYKHSLVLIKCDYKLTKFIVPYSFDAHALGKLLAFLIDIYIFFLIVFDNILLTNRWWFGKLPYQCQRVQINDLNNRIVASTHYRVMINVHTSCLSYHEVYAFL